MKKLEICAYSCSGALAAEANGADRIELCSGASDGGVTPSYGLVEKVVNSVSIPVFPIIRPRGGDFCYSGDELLVMERDIAMFRQLGCAGVSLSILTADNRVDVRRTSLLVELASPMRVTFVRGFDLTPDPMEALEAVKRTGCVRILTSGQAPAAPAGADLLRRLVEAAGDEISIMPGAGVRSSNLKELALSTGAGEFHSSAALRTANPDSDGFGFSGNGDADADEIRRMREILDKI